MSTSGCVYEDFVLLFFLHSHREASILTGELPEESDQFSFFRAARLANLKGSAGLTVPKDFLTLVDHTSSVTFSPLTLSFFYSAVIKSS